MDPLSDVLSLLKPQSYVSRGFRVDDHVAILWPKHEGIKCYAVLSGAFWLRVEGVPEAVLVAAGDCFLLPRGLPFSLSTDPSLTPVDFRTFMDAILAQNDPQTAPLTEVGGNYLAGGHFLLSGSYADTLLRSLPAIVHIRSESDKAAMRWSLERMRDELREPQPGGNFIAQQLACMMLVQALRLHLADGAKGGVGWLFALADKQMSAALAAMHEDPGHAWTLQELAARVGMSRSIFALRFKETVGSTPMEYLTRWRMLLAEQRLTGSDEAVSAIAGSLGYESESAFSKAFRRVMSRSPRQFRRSPRAAAPSASAAGATTAIAAD